MFGRFRLTREPSLPAAFTHPVELRPDSSALAQSDLGARFLSRSGSDTRKWHHYFEVYERWFAPYRGRADLRLLEIGVECGGSLRMWRDTFAAGARIVGIDIDPRCKEHEERGRGIFVEIGDQADAGFLESVVAGHGLFDIVIDDGGHKTAQQTASFFALYPRLADGGIYLVEDLHTNYWPHFRNSRPSFIELAKALVDRLHEPYIAHPSERSFLVGSEERIDAATVSAFCADTRSICFHDSIVVFEKRRKSLPTSELR